MKDKIVNFCDESNEVKYEELSDELKEALKSEFDDGDFEEEDYEETDGECEYDEEIYQRDIFITQINEPYLTEIIPLGATAFDMRGDGDTTLLKDKLINLEVLSVISINAVDVYMCKRVDLTKPAYAFYELDSCNIHIIEFI